MKSSMVNEVFEFTDYRLFMRTYFKSLPREGYGQLSKAARSLNIQPSLLTGILQGAKNLTAEQALEFANYAQMSDLETEYFALLVDLDRAGTTRLRNHLASKLKVARDKSQLIKNRLPAPTELPEQVKAKFYSQWQFSAVRMATSIAEVATVEGIANLLDLNRQDVLRVLEFLIANDLVRESNDGYILGPQSTHIGSGEMLVSRHHANWRLKALEKIDRDPSNGLHFTSPVSVSTVDLDRVRKILLKSLDGIFEIVDPSPPEKVACLCVDWFQVSK